MKRLLLIGIAAFAILAPTAQAAPDPADLAGVNPYTTFVVTRILPNQRETILTTYDWQDGTLTAEQVIRQAAFAFVRTTRINNPAWVIVIYGPIDPPSTFYTNGDRIWDSRTDL